MRGLRVPIAPLKKTTWQDKGSASCCVKGHWDEEIGSDSLSFGLLSYCNVWTFDFQALWLMIILSWSTWRKCVNSTQFQFHSSELRSNSWLWLLLAIKCKHFFHVLQLFFLSGCQRQGKATPGLAVEVNKKKLSPFKSDGMAKVAKSSWIGNLRAQKRVISWGTLITILTWTWSHDNLYDLTIKSDQIGL